MVQSTLEGGKAETKCPCGKICKNIRGLKIHQARSRCGSVTTQTQRTVSTGETQEEPRQETTHSARSLSASESPQDTIGELMDALGLQASQTSQGHHAGMQRRARISWPKLEDDAAWGNFDADVSNILETTLQGNAERKMESLTNIVYNIGKERFGVEEEKSKKAGEHQTPNRRERRIRECRQELKNLNKQFQKENEMEKAGIAILTDDIRLELSKLRRAERLRQKRKHKEKNRAQFIKDPFNFTKGLLGQERSGRLHCRKEEVEAYLQETHSDEQRDEELGIGCRTTREGDGGEGTNMERQRW